MATFIRVNDSKGEGFDLVDYEDLRVSVMLWKHDLPTQIAYIKSLPYEDGDVMICSYPKTGTHWLCNLVHFVRSADQIESKASFNPNLLEMAPISVIDSLPTPRTLATHFKYDRLPTHYLEKGGKIIFVLRNPKDVAVSLFHHVRSRMGTNISWDAYVTCFLGGLVPYASYFDYLHEWQTVIQQHPDQILVVYYEDLKKKCLQELKRIQEYLGYNNDDTRLKQIVDKCSLDSLKADVENGKVNSNLVTKDGTYVPIYRKGEIGDWRNHLTVAQNEQFDKVIERRLRNSMFKFQYV